MYAPLGLNRRALKRPRKGGERLALLINLRRVAGGFVFPAGRRVSSCASGPCELTMATTAATRIAVFTNLRRLRLCWVELRGIFPSRSNRILDVGATLAPTGRQIRNIEDIHGLIFCHHEDPFAVCREMRIRDPARKGVISLLASRREVQNRKAARVSGVA